MSLDIFKERMIRIVPIRCQVCGSWGHSNSGTKWICDACLAKLFDEKRISLPAKRRPQMQISLF